MPEVLKKTYRFICKLEEKAISIFLCAMTVLILISAIGRFVGHPINWAVDISLLLFAWGAFLGADAGIRKNRLINVDFLTSKMPLEIQKTIAVTWSVVIILFLAVLITYGIPLCISNAKRQFQNITLSYSYVTASLPVSAFLMIISTAIRLYRQIVDFPSTLRGGGTDAA
ncbi:MAG: TRAP transporter small permease [Synergistaceae bacterium]|jgi:TRAP-type C4-dicarboxylate transport system permease small subunit|uniref:TRAP transporter small permease n=1 Tax=Aminivibrio sp. TaxID=1872489 RepID=UPI0016A322E2|nr:TRAP transporter small permease [Synergistaceae bacterium]MDD3690327.1 TRAP transporter small permease [Synergistaceae bacterium]MDD4022343.1 TRAP transporter small permease [Synergistaceae bacterium]NCC57137.1 TRAP transporter small permease [Synergistales bacterium]NLO59228.1 TRAP transporter small permease [Synergistaceae bacterium]